MAVIRYKCTVCDREVELIEQPTGLEVIGRCIVTDKCRGTLYKLERLEDFAVGKSPNDVVGLTNYVQRKVLFNHTQAVAESQWTVIHNLGVNPTVQTIVDRETDTDGVVTTSRIEIEPNLVTLVDENTLTIDFDRPESGLAQIIARSSSALQATEAVATSITYLPVTTSQILTIGANLSSNAFPTGPTANSCLVRLYFLDQETLDGTAFATAVSKNYTATAAVNTSAWSNVTTIFVNGVVYTVLTIDIGDPISDIGAPSAGAVLFQSDTSTAGFPYDQSANMVVLLSDSPHSNFDKRRDQLFRPDLNTGPALTLDSFIFANGELTVDQTKVEKVFPPVFDVTATQSHGSPSP